jgi:hypothetical protein
MSIADVVSFPCRTAYDLNAAFAREQAGKSPPAGGRICISQLDLYWKPRNTVTHDEEVDFLLFLVT